MGPISRPESLVNECQTAARDFSDQRGVVCAVEGTQTQTQTQTQTNTNTNTNLSVPSTGYALSHTGYLKQCNGTYFSLRVQVLQHFCVVFKFVSGSTYLFTY